MRKILVLLAHPRLDRSQVHARLLPIARNHPAVSLVDLYGEYPDAMIDVPKEQERLRQHDVILFQHPVYWYSTPAILKDWQDLVLEHGFAYGMKGTALHGKAFGQVASAGAPNEDYRKQGSNRAEIRDMFLPMRAMARLCGMTYLEPLVLFEALDAKAEGRLADFTLAYQTYLDTLANPATRFDEFQHRGDLLGVLRSLVGR